MPEQNPNSHLLSTGFNITSVSSAGSSSSSSSASSSSSSSAGVADDDNALWLERLRSDFGKIHIEDSKMRDPKKYYEECLDAILLLFFNKNNDDSDGNDDIKCLHELSFNDFFHGFYGEKIQKFNTFLKEFFLKAAFNGTTFSLSKEENKIVTLCIRLCLHGPYSESSDTARVDVGDLYIMINLFSKYLLKEAKDDLYHQLCQANPPIKNISVSVWSMLFQLPLPEGALSQALESPTDRQWQYNLWHWALSTSHKEALAQLQQDERALPLLTAINTYGENALRYAIHFKHEHKLIAWMLTHESVRDGINDQGMQIKAPLFLAVLRRDTKLATLLLASGANVNAVVRKDWMTLLHVAAQLGNLRMVESLLDHGANVHGLADITSQDYWYETFPLDDESDPQRRGTPLHLAARHGYTEVVELLLARGAAIDFGDCYGTTSLHIAILANHLPVVGLLMTRGANLGLFVGCENFSGIADFNDEDTSVATPMLLAAYEGHLEIVEKLLNAGRDVHEIDENENLALHVAAKRGHSQVVEFLLDRGAAINLGDTSGFSALHWAAIYGHRLVVERLLDRGAIIDLPNNEGNSALHMAVLYRKLDVVDLLIKRGADVDLINTHGKTPLNLSLTRGHQAITQALLDAGANPHKTCVDNGQTPIHIIAEKHPELLEYAINAVPTLSQSQCFDMGAAIDPGDVYALHAAVKDGDTRTIKRLLEGGAPINLLDPYGRSALYIAVRFGYFDIVCLLIGSGADIDLLNKDGSSALHVAVFRGYLDIVRLLIRYGASVDFVNENGESLLNLSISGECQTITQVLLDAGANPHTSYFNDGQAPIHMIAWKIPELLHCANNWVPRLFKPSDQGVAYRHDSNAPFKRLTASS